MDSMKTSFPLNFSELALSYASCNKYFVILDPRVVKWYFVVIFHRKLCVQTIDPGICTIHRYLAIFLSAGTLQMVSEHCVACRIEILGLVRNKNAHRTKKKFIWYSSKTFLCHSCNLLTIHFPQSLLLFIDVTPYWSHQVPWRKTSIQTSKHPEAPWWTQGNRGRVVCTQERDRLDHLCTRITRS